MSGAPRPLEGATCTIDGFGVHVEREVCEVCSKDTAVIDVGIVIMDCNACTQVYRESGFTNGEPIVAGECRSRSDALSLAWTSASPYCVDIYAYLGSGTLTGGGTLLQVADEVRVCRCDRTTDTCVSCLEGACEDMPADGANGQDARRYGL